MVTHSLTNSQTLQLCADLANGSKHLALTKSRTGDPSTDITRNDATVLLGTGGLSKHAFYIESGRVEHNVLDVAEGAVAEWEIFLRRRHLVWIAEAIRRLAAVQRADAEPGASSAGSPCLDIEDRATDL
jgi:hypothetical protein